MKHPHPKGLYAWNKFHAGSFLLFVESLSDYCKFLFLPGPTEFCLTKEDFDKNLKSNVLEFVEELPDDIFKETIQFYELSCPPKKLNIETYEK